MLLELILLIQCCLKGIGAVKCYSCASPAVIAHWDLPTNIINTANTKNFSISNDCNAAAGLSKVAAADCNNDLCLTIYSRIRDSAMEVYIRGCYSQLMNYQLSQQQQQNLTDSCEREETTFTAMQAQQVRQVFYCQADLCNKAIRPQCKTPRPEENATSCGTVRPLQRWCVTARLASKSHKTTLLYGSAMNPYGVDFCAQYKTVGERGPVTEHICYAKSEAFRRRWDQKATLFLIICLLLLQICVL